MKSNRFSFPIRRSLNTTLVAVGVALIASSVQAQDSFGNFGAETIIDDPTNTTVNLPLPVEQVEERAPALVPSRQRATTPDAAELASLEMELGEGSEESETDELIRADSSNEGKGSAAAFGPLMKMNEVEVEELIKLFGKVLKRNYIIDSAVKGKVTFSLESPVSLEEATKIFYSVLLLKGFTTVPIGDNIWKVVPAKDARQTTVPLVFDTEDNPSDILVTHLVRLEHVQAQDMRQLLSQFISKDGVINSFAGTNSLILIDSQANIARLKRLVNQLDVPASDQEITIVPIINADANDIAEKIKEILGEEEQQQQQARSTSARRQRAARRQASGRTSTTTSTAGGNVDASRTLPIKIIPDERTNSLIVVADEASTAKVQALVEQLDSPVDLSGGRFYVYRLKHADSEELSEILSQLISGTDGTSTSTGRTSGSSLTRSSRETTNTNQARRSSAAERLAQVLRNRRSRRDAETGASGGKVQFEGEVTIAPDPATNTLIINAARSDYLKVKELLDQLDVKRRQVLVEATILEVSLNKQEGLGVEFQTTGGSDDGGAIAQTNFGGLTDLFTNPAALSDLTVAAASSGTITLPGGIVLPSQAVLITALSRISNVNVLSAPTILTTDNQEAEIIVGENVPFVSSTSTDPSNLNNTFNSIERQDVGITLRITPQISTGEFVTLQSFVEISNVVPGTRNDANGPTTTIRTTETTVEVRSGQMIVTGGLISDQQTESTRGVPFLQDIPFLGNFFQRQDIDHRRNNLLVFITPKIVRDQFDAREETVERRDSMQAVIDEQETEPNRSSVLHSKRIDQVSESIPAGEISPTPITPPSRVGLPESGLSAMSDDERAAVERTNARLKSLLKPPEPALPSASANTVNPNEIIDVEASPEVPGSSMGNRESSNPAASRPMLATSKHSNQGYTQSTGATYVVLRSLSSDVSNLPFQAADDLGTLALVVPGTLQTSAGSYFEVGQRYRYGSETAFICLGRYASLEEASQIHPSLAERGSWHHVSPKDMLQLGKTSWVKSNS